jgi:hypothetical protein
MSIEGNIMNTNPIDSNLTIYHSSGVGDLRRIVHLDGASFMTHFYEPHDNGPAISVGVELRIAKAGENVALTMRRVADKPDGWDCSTAAIWLTSEATQDLINALSDVD